MLAAGITYDPATNTLVVHVPPGTDELRSAQFTFTFYDATGFNAPGTFVPGVVTGNTLTFDLSGQITASVTTIQGGAFQLNDACGLAGYTGSFALQIDFTRDAGIVGVNISCYPNV
jgi:hypothetical protein